MPADKLLDDYVRIQDAGIRCPICGKPDWCLIARDGKSAVCPRVTSDVLYSRKAGHVHELPGGVPLAEDIASTNREKLPAAVVTECVRQFRAQLYPGPRNALASNLGVKLWTLRALNVGWHEHAFAFPMRVDTRPEFRGVRFRAMSGRKWSLTGGREGLFVPNNFGRSAQVFTCEGPTDTAALLSCGLDGFGRPNRCGGWPESIALLKQAEADSVIVISDTDGDGLRDAAEFHELLAQQFQSVVRVVPAKFKDARETIQAAGFTTARHSLSHAIENGRNSLWERL